MSNSVVPRNVKLGARYITAIGLPEQYDYNGKCFLSHLQNKKIKMVTGISDDHITLSSVGIVEPDVIYDRITGYQIGIAEEELIKYNEVDHILSTDSKDVDDLLLQYISEILPNNK